MTIQNKLLSGLPSTVLSRLRPALRACSLPPQQTLFRPQEPIGAVWFVESGGVSLMMSSSDGKQTEVGLIGPEGMVGQSVAVGVDTAHTEAVVRIGGTALRMDVSVFRRVMHSEPIFRSTLLRYTEAVYAQAAQVAICNGHHAVEQRLARWLLTASDRSGGARLRTTQEQLASILGVYRPSVSLAAQALQQAKVIHYARGEITIIGRAALEAMACDCYSAQKQRFDDLMNARWADEAMVAWTAPARPWEEGFVPQEYRVHLLDTNRHCVAVDTYRAADDREAIETASLIFSSCNDALGGWELWRGTEIIASDREALLHRLPSLDELSLRRQLSVCAREETLSNSFACIRDSRKLLSTLSDLKQRLDGAA